MDINAWHRESIGDIVLYRAWNLQQTGIVHHAFSARLGGISNPPNESLNLGLHVGDNPQSVTENRRRLSVACGFAVDSMVCAEQVHGCSIAAVTVLERGRGASSYEDSIPAVDALICNTTGLVLTLYFADCVPVFIVDPVHRAIGLAHAGWKGTSESIAARTLDAMAASYNTNARNCVAAIGPAIGRCCYEVSSDVASRVLKAAGDDRIIANSYEGKFQLDLKLANWLILRRAGIAESNIALSTHCTSCNREDFFSYRRDGQTGRMAAILALR